jgi:hypothetical protein
MLILVFLFLKQMLFVEAVSIFVFALQTLQKWISYPAINGICSCRSIEHYVVGAPAENLYFFEIEMAQDKLIRLLLPVAFF